MLGTPGQAVVRDGRGTLTRCALWKTTGSSPTSGEPVAADPGRLQGMETRPIQMKPASITLTQPDLDLGERRFVP
jgi:hypothetical protein